MNVQVAQGSEAERRYHARKGLPSTAPPEEEVIAPGVHPTPAHDLVFHGGKTLPDLHFVNFYLGGGAWPHTDLSAIDHALAAALADRNLNNVMAQYFSGHPITSSLDGSTVLPGPPPGTVSQGDAESLVAKLYADGKLGGHDLGVTVFNLLLPPGTVLTDDMAPTGPAASGVRTAPPLGAPVEDAVDSLHGLGGYHGSIHPAKHGGGTDTVYYAIGVYSERKADGTVNGIPVFDHPWKNVVATFYHELNEARTDADVGDAIRAGNDPSAAKFLGWVSRQGEECGDFPVFEARPLTQVFQEVPLTDGTGVVPVQFEYSNRVHGPEGPTPVNPPPPPPPGGLTLLQRMHGATREVVLAWLFDNKGTGNARLDAALQRLAPLYREWEGQGEPTP